MDKFKNSLVMIVLVIFVGAIAIVFYFSDVTVETRFNKEVESKNVTVVKSSISHHFKMILTDLLFLADAIEYEWKVEGDNAHTLAETAHHFAVMSQKKGLYDQIRYIDENGMETIRINYGDGKAKNVIGEGLQNKRSRYYFKDTFRLNRGDIYLSPLDLNIEGGEIEVPLKPVIRFGTPVFDPDGKKRGIVIVNFLVSGLLDQITASTQSSIGNLMLLNSKGYWFIGPAPKDEWGFMFPDRKDKTFGNVYKDEWSIINSHDSGQINTSAGMFTYQTVSPLRESLKRSAGSAKASAPGEKQYMPNENRWKIVSHVKPEVLLKSREPFFRLAMLYMVSILVLAIGSWVVDRKLGQTIGVPMGGELSPLILLGTIAIVIFISELMVMMILPFLQPLSEISEAFVDASAMIIMVIPTLYFMLYRPLNHHIAQRALAENKLKEKTNFIDSMLRSSIDVAIVATDLDFRITYYNPVAEKIFGYSPHEAIGQTVMEIHSQEKVAPERLKKAIKIVEKEGIYRFTNNLKKEGGMQYLDSRISGIYDKNRNMFGYMMMSRDVTDKRIADREREEFIVDLDRVNTELKDFAYIVSHDLKAPLRAISALAGWVYKDYFDKLDGEGREHLELLMSRTKRMNNLIEGILRYSRVGRVKPEMVRLDSLSVIRNVVDGIDPPDNIIVTIEEPLPNIVYDQTHFTQIFQNLIGNAIFHLGKPDGVVAVSCVDDSEYWSFSVKDNGIGIEEKHFERIFKIFQGLKARDEVESTGIGLSLVKKIVESNGGSISVQSGVGVGSEFVFTIPKSINLHKE